MAMSKDIQQEQFLPSEELSLETIGAMLRANIQLEIIYAYIATTRIVTAINAKLLTKEDLKEWNDAIKQAMKFLPKSAKSLEYRASGLIELVEQKAPLYIIYIFLRTGLIKNRGKVLDANEEKNWQRAAKEFDRIYDLYYGDCPSFKRPR